MAFEEQQQPSYYEQPVVKHIKQSPLKQTMNANTSTDADYDIPDMDSIPIATSHSLKLPAEYDEVTGESNGLELSPEYDEVVGVSHDYLNQQDPPVQEFDSGYHLLEDVSMSPSRKHQSSGSVSNEYSRIPTPVMQEPTLDRPSQPSNSHVHTRKSKTLTPAPTDYETPVDADAKGHTIPANFENYETPL